MIVGEKYMVDLGLILNSYWVFVVVIVEEKLSLSSVLESRGLYAVMLWL